MDKLEEFIREHEITEVECLVPDMSGIARGKIIPAEKLLRILRERGMPIPESVFVQTVTGDYPDEKLTSASMGDVYMIPDNNTVRLVTRNGTETWPDLPKEEVARRLVERIAAWFAANTANA